jgi:hypothetical protein
MRKINLLALGNPWTCFGVSPLLDYLPIISTYERWAAGMLQDENVCCRYTGILHGLEPSSPSCQTHHLPPRLRPPPIPQTHKIQHLHSALHLAPPIYTLNQKYM